MSTAARAGAGRPLDGPAPAIFVPTIFVRGGSQLFAVVFGSYFLSLPVHAGGVWVVDLHAIHSYVAFAGFGIARDYAR